MVITECIGPVQDLCSDVEDVTGQCERISEQLLSLEDQLQAAIDTQDHQLTHIL